MTRESAFEMAVSSIRFGSGVTREVGMDLKDLGIRTALVFIDPNLRHLPPAATVLESLEDNGIKAVVYDRVRVEPSDESFQRRHRLRSRVSSRRLSSHWVADRRWTRRRR